MSKDHLLTPAKFADTRRLIADALRHVAFPTVDDAPTTHADPHKAADPQAPACGQ